MHQAEQLENDYDWFEAAGLYEKAVSLLPQDDFSKVGEIYERLGYALYRAAFQAESKDDFRERLRRTILSCQQAKELYGRLDDPLKTPRTGRCDAMTALVGYLAC